MKAPQHNEKKGDDFNSYHCALLGDKVERLARQHAFVGGTQCKSLIHHTTNELDLITAHGHTEVITIRRNGDIGLDEGSRNRLLAADESVGHGEAAMGNHRGTRKGNADSS